MVATKCTHEGSLLEPFLACLQTKQSNHLITQSCWGGFPTNLSLIFRLQVCFQMLNLTKGLYLEILQVILSPSSFLNKEFPGFHIKGKKILSTNKLAVAFSHFTLLGSFISVITSLFC